MAKLGDHSTALAQLEPDQDVEHANQHHRRHKEDQGTDLECVAHRRVLDRAHSTVGNAHHSELARLRQSSGEGEYPNSDDKLDRTRQLGHGLLPEGVTDRDVAFDGEGADRKDRDVGRRLGQQRVEHTDGAPKGILRGVPEVVQVRRHGRQQHQHVGDGQVEEVVVGGGVHRLVP